MIASSTNVQGRLTALLSLIFQISNHLGAGLAGHGRWFKQRLSEYFGHSEGYELTGKGIKHARSGSKKRVTAIPPQHPGCRTILEKAHKKEALLTVAKKEVGSPT